MEGRPQRRNAPWGDKFGPKLEDAFRIGLLNINSLPEKKYMEKNLSLRDFIQDKELDCIGLTETNIHWKALPITERLHE